MGRRPAVRNRGQHQAAGQWLRTTKRRAIYERDGWICGGHLAGNGGYCGRYLGNDPIEEVTVDHIRPRSDGGTNHESNLVTCCMECNGRKRGQSIEPPFTNQEPSTMSTAPSAGGIRNRIVEIRNVPAAELLDNHGNPRRHPSAQRSALRGILEEIGIVGMLVAYPSERNGGKLTLIDGHLRKDEYDGEWPVAITDLTDQEADKLLQAYDAVGALATYDQLAMSQLIENEQFADASVRIMLDELMAQFKTPRDRREHADGEQSSEADATIAEMELKPYEHYDYVLVLCRNTFDWNYLCERLGLKRVNGGPDPRYQKPGLGRAIPADLLIKTLREADAAIAAAKSKQAKKPAKGDANTQ